MQLENNNLIIHAGKEIDHMSAERIRREFEECYMTGKVKNVYLICLTLNLWTAQA